MNAIARLVPQNLAGRLIALVLAVIVVAHTVTFLVLADERSETVRAVSRGQVLTRTVSAVRLLEQTPPVLGGRIVAAASGPWLRFSVDDRPQFEKAAQEGVLGRRIAASLARVLGDEGRDIRVRLAPGTAWSGRRPMTGYGPMAMGRHHGHWEGDDDDGDGGHRAGEWRPLELGLSVRLASGGWLNAQTMMPVPGLAWAGPSLIALAITALSVVVAIAWMIRGATRPLARLSAAAGAFGRGRDTGPVPETGPEDVRRTIAAFNQMRERLTRFVADRTRMLAAVSHDLRTPVTALRLRTEMVEDAGLKAKMLQTLDDMQEMVEATLAFARDEAQTEASRSADLAALLDSICADFADLGAEVRYQGPDRLIIDCRPASLRRAVTNLVQNAVTYGGAATVELRAQAGAIQICVGDPGPGIPEADQERVFEAFVRLEESRSRETGGIGLGLSIARSIARAHGGDITLANRPGGGLLATLTLPMDETGAE